MKAKCRETWRGVEEEVYRGRTEGGVLCRCDPEFFCPYLSAGVPGELFGFCGPLALSLIHI